MVMQVKDIMSREPVIVNEMTTIREAAHKMATHNLGMLLVGKQERVLGLITDRDLVVRGLANGRDPDKDQLVSLLDHPPITCPDHKTVEEAIEIMENCKIRRLLVTDKSNLPVGVISIDDIAVRYDDDQLVARALHRIAEETAVPVSILHGRPDRSPPTHA